MSEPTQNEKKEKLTCCERVTRLLKPIKNYNSDPTTRIISYEVVPEAIRIYLYIYFILFCVLAATISTSFKSFNKHDNPIKNTYGNNNICVYFDDPPFSHMAAALFTPMIIIMFLYLYFDWVRFHNYYVDPNYPDVTSFFYILYTIFSVIILLTTMIFMQVFGTQPTQSMAVHFLPFLGWMFGLWFLSFFHFIFFVKIGVVSKENGPISYYIGVVYLVLMVITVIIKATLNLTNLAVYYENYADAQAGKQYQLWHKPGFGWVNGLSDINDKFFMIFIVLCPIIVQFYFTDELHSVKVSYKVNNTEYKRVDNNYDTTDVDENDNLMNE